MNHESLVQISLVFEIQVHELLFRDAMYLDEFSASFVGTNVQVQSK